VAHAVAARGRRSPHCEFQEKAQCIDFYLLGWVSVVGLEILTCPISLFPLFSGQVEDGKK